MKDNITSGRGIVISFGLVLLLLVGGFSLSLGKVYRNLEEEALSAREETLLMQTGNMARMLDQIFDNYRRALDSAKLPEHAYPTMKGMDTALGAARLEGVAELSEILEGRAEVDVVFNRQRELAWSDIFRYWQQEGSLARALEGEGADPLFLPFYITPDKEIYLGLYSPVFRMVYLVAFHQIIENYLIPFDFQEPGSLMVGDGLGRVLWDEDQDVIGHSVYFLHRNYPAMQRLDDRMLLELQGTERYRFIDRDRGGETEKIIAWTSLSLDEGGETRLVVGAANNREDVLASFAGVRLFLHLSIIGFSLAAGVLFFGSLALRRKYEKAKEKQLLSLVDQRTAELQQLTRQKDRLMSIVAHDMKGPLGALHQLLLFMDENLTSFSSENIAQIIKELKVSSGSVYDLAVNMLHWARRQDSRIALDLKPLEVHALMEKTRDLLVKSAEAKEVDLQVVLGDPLFAAADSDLLQLILRNLVSNALKFTPPGGQVILSAQKKGETVVLSVTDTGAGFPPEVLKKLFDVENPYTSKGTRGESGSGLGLVVCRDFAQKMGGSLSLGGKPGSGAVVSVIIPQAEGENDEPAADEPAAD